MVQHIPCQVRIPRYISDHNMVTAELQLRRIYPRRHHKNSKRHNKHKVATLFHDTEVRQRYQDKIDDIIQNQPTHTWNQHTIIMKQAAKETIPLLPKSTKWNYFDDPLIQQWSQEQKELLNVCRNIPGNNNNKQEVKSKRNSGLRQIKARVEHLSEQKSQPIYKTWRETKTTLKCMSPQKHYSNQNQNNH